MKRFLVLLLLLVTTNLYSADFIKDIVVTNGVWIDSRAYSTFAAAISASAEGKILVVNKAESVTANSTIASDVICSNNGTITVDTGHTVTFSGNFVGRKGCLLGAGDYDFKPGSEVYATWFSSLTDALNKCSDDNVTLVIDESGTITSNITLGSNLKLKWKSTGNVITVNSTYTLSGIYVKDTDKFQLFAGSGDFDFVSGSTVRSSWFSTIYLASLYITDDTINFILDKTEVMDHAVTLSSTLTVNTEYPYVVTTNSLALTINGNFIKQDTAQCFSGIGVVFGKYTTVYPEWWGAVGDANTTTRSGTDDTAKIQSAITSLYSGGILKITKWYGVVGEVAGTAPNQFTRGLKTTRDNVIMEGITSSTSGFVLISGLYPGYCIQENDEARVTNWEIRNLGFYASSDTSLYYSAAASSGAIRFYLFDYIKIHDCAFHDFTINGSFYGGLGDYVSTNLRFYNNLVDAIGVTAYVGMGVTFADRIWVYNNYFVNVAMAVSLETAGGAGYYIKNFHVNNNTCIDLTTSTYSVSNPAIGVQVDAMTGSYIANGDISGNIINGLTEATAATSGTHCGVSLTASDKGGVHHVAIRDNVMDGFTPDSTAPNTEGIHVYHSDYITIVGNTIGNLSVSAGSTYALALYDSRYCTVTGNTIEGNYWSHQIYEYATGLCYNNIVGNMCTNDSSTFPYYATSFSTIIHKNNATGRLQIYDKGYYVLKEEDGVLYDGSANQYYSVYGTPADGYVVKWTTTGIAPHAYWSVP